MTNNLKPCPFCGGEAHVVEGMYSSYQEGYAVRCRHCALTLGASGRLGECYEWSCCYETEAEAIEAWNTRAERTCRFFPVAGDENKPYYEQTGNCSECFGMMYGSDSYCPDCGARVIR